MEIYYHLPVNENRHCDVQYFIPGINVHNKLPESITTIMLTEIPVLNYNISANFHINQNQCQLHALLFDSILEEKRVCACQVFTVNVHKKRH